MKSQEPKYTIDWFSNNIPRWEEHFLKLKKKPIKALELGTYEGRSAIWMLDNVLLHKNSHITCIDDFSVKKSVQKTLMKNIEPYGDKIEIIASSTRDALKSPELLSKTFDFIYIDADRSAKHVLEDAILAFPLLKIGGVIVLDDYTNSKTHDYSCPKKGIDAFLDMFSDELQVINSTWQVIAIKKKSNIRKKCVSELFDK